MLKAIASILRTPVSLSKTDQINFYVFNFKSEWKHFRYDIGTIYAMKSTTKVTFFIGCQQKIPCRLQTWFSLLKFVLTAPAIWVVHNTSEVWEACETTSCTKRNGVYVSLTPGRDRISPCTLEGWTTEGSTPLRVCICIRNHSLSLIVTSVKHKCNRSDGATVID